MELQRARNAKRALETALASRVRDASTKERNFAVGLAPGVAETHYRVAIRAPAPESVTERDLRLIQRFAGDDYDLRYTGTIAPLTGASSAPSGSAPVLRIGDSIAHCRCTAGTLGFFARRTIDGVVGLVSNNHVIALEDEGKEGDEIVHPGPMDGGDAGSRVVAHLAGGYPTIHRKQARVDCAFALLVESLDFDPHTLGSAGRVTLASAVIDLTEPVAKIGRTTQLTHGTITAFELDDLPVMYSQKRIRFFGQIEVQSTDDDPFSKGGDSGSLVFTHPRGVPVGIVFAGSAMGGKDKIPLTYVNPIDAVLTSLGVGFVP